MVISMYYYGESEIVFCDDHSSDKLDFTTFGFGNYSLSEVDTKFTWINDKTIFAKTVNVGAMPNSTTKSVAHGITGLEYVVWLEGRASNSSGVFIALNFANGVGPSSSIGLTLNGANIQILAGANQSSFSGYVTVYYTKI